MDGSPTVGELVGRKLQAVRERQLFSRRELAKRSGVSEPTIARLEHGGVPRPRHATVEKLAQALGVPFEDLTRMQDQPRPLAEAAEAPPPDSSERREPVYISAASGGASGSTADILAGLDEHFDAIVAPLRQAGLGEDEVAEIVSQEVRKRVAG